MTKSENRNQFVDFMRGIAMLLVVLGHTITECMTGAEEIFLINIVIFLSVMAAPEHYCTRNIPTWDCPQNGVCRKPALATVRVRCPLRDVHETGMWVLPYQSHYPFYGV